MSKVRKVIIAFTISLVFLLSILYVSRIGNTVLAETDLETLEQSTTENALVDETAEPLLFTSLTISLNGGDGKVWATVKNEFTLFPSTVLVIVQLYYSYTYCESYTDMVLISENSSTDLDIGKTVIAEASTDGEQKYWMGRMRYKIDGGSWKEKTVGVLLYSADGEYIGIL